jgi:hypothetical protein
MKRRGYAQMLPSIHPLFNLKDYRLNTTQQKNCLDLIKRYVYSLFEMEIARWVPV